MVVIVDTYEITNNSRTQKELETAKVQYEVRSLTKAGDSAPAPLPVRPLV